MTQTYIPQPGPAVRPLRSAATLVVVRDGVDGMQVLLLRRAEKEGDQNSGACVFPGGTIDTHDASMHSACCGLDDAVASERLRVPSRALDFYIAAVRECFEEAGILFASDADDRIVALDDLPAAELAGLRAAAQEGTDALLQVCRDRGWRLAVDRLAYLSHWLTPPGMPRRFDTRFFVALMPPGQTASPDQREIVEHLWLRPAEALDPARGLKLVNVTRRIVEQLREFDSAEACLAHTRALRDIPLIMPRVAIGARGRRPVHPGEPAYAELGRIDPEGRGDERYDSEPGLATRLSPHVVRVADARASQGGDGEHGAHSYLVGGGERNEWALIDAGADDDAHAAAILAAAPGAIRWVLATRGDAAGSRLARAGAAVPRLSAGDVLDVDGVRLRALRPADAGADASALCFLLEADKTLFSGHWNAAAPSEPAADIEWLAPAKGFLIPYARPPTP